MVTVLASSAVDRGFEAWLGQSKEYKKKTERLGIKIMFPSGATRLPAGCFSELAL